MSHDDKLRINPIAVESKIIDFIRSTLEPRGIEGLVILYRDEIESLVASKLAISSVGRENVKIIVAQGRFSSRTPKPTLKTDLETIDRFIDLPRENIVQINIEALIQELNRVFVEKADYIPGLRIIDSIPILNYNLSYILLREMARDDFNLQQYAPPTKKPRTEKDKFIQRSIAHHKSQIRLNMLLGFLLAESENKSLLGLTNKTERLLGLFTKFGTSHAVDLLPLGTLYRTQVVDLANHLGLDAYIQDKRGDTVTSYKFFFNITYKEVDRILVRLEAGISKDKIAIETNISLETIQKIEFHYEGSDYARRVPLLPKL